MICVWLWIGIGIVIKCFEECDGILNWNRIGNDFDERLGPLVELDALMRYISVWEVDFYGIVVLNSLE